jgi:hypothetical protein
MGVFGKWNFVYFPVGDAACFHVCSKVRLMVHVLYTVHEEPPAKKISLYSFARNAAVSLCGTGSLKEHRQPSVTQ